MNPFIKIHIFLNNIFINCLIIIIIIQLLLLFQHFLLFLYYSFFSKILDKKIFNFLFKKKL